MDSSLNIEFDIEQIKKDILYFEEELKKLEDIYNI
jgi:hypothetical protein